jgi:hypothetical protein
MDFRSLLLGVNRGSGVWKYRMDIKASRSGMGHGERYPEKQENNCFNVVYRFYDK